jgi:hypothetical protein
MRSLRQRCSNVQGDLSIQRQHETGLLSPAFLGPDRLSDGRAGYPAILSLMAEDDPGVHDYIVKSLRDLDYRVLEAADADAALAIIAASDSPIDLLLTDVVSPP